ncbi:MAG: hypothetical protein R2932_06700 [Caldilineaceae bacterium]
MAAPLILLWLGIGFVMQGSLSLGAMLGLNALAAAFLAPLSSLVANAKQLQLVGAQLERLSDVLQAQPEQDCAVLPNAPALRGQVELNAVTFHYAADVAGFAGYFSLDSAPAKRSPLWGGAGPAKVHSLRFCWGFILPHHRRNLLRWPGTAHYELSERTHRWALCYKSRFFEAGRSVTISPS